MERTRTAWVLQGDLRWRPRTVRSGRWWPSAAAELGFGETAGVAGRWKGGRGEAARGRREEGARAAGLGMAHPERCAIRMFFI